MVSISQGRQAIAATEELGELTRALASLAAMQVASVSSVALEITVPGYVAGGGPIAGARVTISVPIAQAITFLTARQTLLQGQLTGLGFSPT